MSVWPLKMKGTQLLIETHGVDVMSADITQGNVLENGIVLGVALSR